MEYILEVDDTIKVIWANGRGYDIFRVVKGEYGIDPEHTIRYEGSVMYDEKGKAVKL